ncbi:MAG TPA: PTS galactitol transporter subunit IIB [Micropruina sp.]|jgi:PTS system galactitol-specific IIB component|nr:PTS galactitol transporter subunit IIB [Micropruina sp.]
MKRVLIICGTGIATSTVVASKVRDHLQEVGLQASVDQGKVMDLLRGDIEADLIVATTDVPDTVTVPVVRAIALLTGFGEDEVYRQIDSHLS